MKAKKILSRIAEFIDLFCVRILFGFFKPHGVCRLPLKSRPSMFFYHHSLTLGMAHAQEQIWWKRERERVSEWQTTDDIDVGGISNKKENIN